MSDTVPLPKAYAIWAASYDLDHNRTRDLDAAVLRATPLALDGARVLEFGAGTGKNTAYLASRAAQVLALDLSEAMLAKAAAKVAGGHVRFVCHDIRQPWPAESGSQDVVVGNLVLEHVEHLAPPLREAARVLRSGGLLVLCELHPFRQWQGAGARFGAPGAEQRVEAYTHTTSDYVTEAIEAGFVLRRMAEPRDLPGEDPASPPRLLQLVLQRR